MKLCTAVQEGCGYNDTLRAHRYFAPSEKYFTVCITYQPPLIILHNSLFWHAMSCMPFWRFSRSTLIISVNSIYWLIFVVRTEFSVRHELTFYTHIIWANKNPYHCQFVVDKLAVGQVFVREFRFCPISIIPPISILIFILILLVSEGQESAARECSNVAILFRVSGGNGKESTSTSFSRPLKSKRVKSGNLPTKVVYGVNRRASRKKINLSLKGWYFVFSPTPSLFMRMFFHNYFPYIVFSTLPSSFLFPNILPFSFPNFLFSPHITCSCLIYFHYLFHL